MPISLLSKLFKKKHDPRHDWLLERNTAHHSQIKKLVQTGVKNDLNFISLVHDAEADTFWVSHYREASSMAGYFEYQPISHDQAQAIQANPEEFRKFALHDWVEST